MGKIFKIINSAFENRYIRIILFVMYVACYLLAIFCMSYTDNNQSFLNKMSNMGYYVAVIVMGIFSLIIGYIFIINSLINLYNSICDMEEIFDVQNIICIVLSAIIFVSSLYIIVKISIAAIFIAVVTAIAFIAIELIK